MSLGVNGGIFWRLASPRSQFFALEIQADRPCDRNDNLSNAFQGFSTLAVHKKHLGYKN